MTLSRQAFARSRLRRYLTRTVTIEPATGRTRQGQTTYGLAVTYPARIAGKVQQIRAATGEDRVSVQQITIEGGPPISPFDRLTLPDGTRPPLLAVQQVLAETDIQYTVLYTG